MIDEKLEMRRSTVWGHWIIRKNGVVYRTWTSDIEEALEYVNSIRVIPVACECGDKTMEESQQYDSIV